VVHDKQFNFRKSSTPYPSYDIWHTKPSKQIYQFTCKTKLPLSFIPPNCNKAVELMHLSILSPTTPFLGKGGGFEFLKSQIPHPWSTKSIQSPPGKVAVEAKLIL